MKSKKILILALLISSTVGLLGCSNTNSKQISSTESSLTEDNTSDKNNNSSETAKKEEEDFYDSVLPNGQRHITVGNTTYLVGGPTDVSLNDDNKDFQVFLSIKNKCA